MEVSTNRKRSFRRSNLIRRHQNNCELFLTSNGLDLLLDYCQSPEWSSYVAGALHCLILKSYEVAQRCASLERWCSPQSYPEIRKDRNSDGCEADGDGLNLSFRIVIPQLRVKLDSWYGLKRLWWLIRALARNAKVIK